MSPRPLVIDIVDDVDGAPRIRIKSGNGKILFATEAYEGGAAKAEHAVNVLTSKIADGDYVVKRNGELA